MPNKIVIKGEKKLPSPKEAGKLTGVRETNQAIRQLVELFDKLLPKDQVVALKEMGVGSKFFTCQHCGEVKTKDKFYVSTAPGQASGITDGCKKCAEEIAVPTVNGEKQQPTKQTVDDALYFLNKPMLESVWEASLLEAANGATGKSKNNVWTSYIKNIQMVNYYTQTYRNSDNYTGGVISLEDMADNALPKDQEIIEQFEKNKNDVLRLLGYLPFEHEKLSAQPFLYSQLVGFLDSDEECNDDMMRIASIISIVTGFYQASQIDKMVAQLSQDFRNAEKNIATIKALQQMKAQVLTGVNNLAKESCISLKNSKHSIKGENTWTGKLKKIKDLNLRGSEVNGFDIATCRGMQQVQELSDASIMKQLALDESEWSDIVAEMRTTNQSLRKERDQYRELNRILLRENLDLKDYLEENEMLPNVELLHLDDLYSVFADEDDSEEVTDDESASSTA